MIKKALLLILVTISIATMAYVETEEEALMSQQTPIREYEIREEVFTKDQISIRKVNDFFEKRITKMPAERKIKIDNKYIKVDNIRFSFPETYAGIDFYNGEYIVFLVKPKNYKQKLEYLTFKNFLISEDMPIRHVKRSMNELQDATEIAHYTLSEKAKFLNGIEVNGIISNESSNNVGIWVIDINDEKIKKLKEYLGDSDIYVFFNSEDDTRLEIVE